MNKSFNKTRLGNGTREWSDSSCNICIGCSHGCLYCYARSFRARFDGSVRIPGNWERQQLRPGTKLGADVMAAGVVMFPTAHDITPEILPEAVTTIRNLLTGKNRVLVVSKPHLSVVKTLCHEFADQKTDILFRFTIGSLDGKLCEFWEPGAPAPAERIQALQLARASGFATSVSVEPMLGSVDATSELVSVLEPYVTDTVWVGKMQRIPVKLNAHIPGFVAARDLVRSQQTDAEILRLVDRLKGNPKVRWKDSIKAVMERAAANNNGNNII